MSNTVAIKENLVGKRAQVVELSVDTYAAGGVALGVGETGFKHIDHVGILNVSGQNYVAVYDSTAGKIKLYDHDGITAGTPAGTMVPKHECIDIEGITKPVIALTHNANPAGGLAAAPLYLVEDQGQASANIGRLESTTAANANVNGETADGSVYGVTASCRFFVKDSDAPAGVPIYVNEASSDRLEFVSPTETDAWIIMPFEMAAGAPPGAAVAVKVYHSADAANGKALYFDDNGAADAQLCFVDTGATGGVIPAADIVVLRPIAVENAAANLGAFTGAEMGTHQHAAEVGDGAVSPACVVTCLVVGY